MAASPKHRQPLVRSLKAYVALRTGIILASFLLLIAAWFTVQTRLRHMRRQILADAHELDAARDLENLLLSAGREDLLWRATGDAVHRDRKTAILRRSVDAAEHLHTAGAPPEEQQIADDIRTGLTAFRDEADAQPMVPITKSQLKVEDLLATLNRYIEKNQSDMEATMRAALRVQQTMDRLAIGVVALSGVLLALGSAGLLRRVIRPTLALTRAARRLGRGDLTARAPVLRNDELGALCRTFNQMAEDAANHERTRLEFVALVAHDLKSPLITIGGGARRLRSGKLDPERQAAWLDRIIQQAGRLERLTHDLMDTVQVSTGRFSLQKTELDLTALLREVCREQAEVFSDHRLTFEGDEACRVMGDRDRIERVAVNLISNAAKYSPKESAIELRVARAGPSAVFTVTDHGAGVPPEELELIFQPFGRGSQAPLMAKGTGLGMNVVKQILEAHEGSVTVRSALEKGTTVEVTLPLAAG